MTSTNIVMTSNLIIRLADTEPFTYVRTAFTVVSWACRASSVACKVRYWVHKCVTDSVVHRAPAISPNCNMFVTVMHPWLLGECTYDVSLGWAYDNRRTLVKLQKNPDFPATSLPAAVVQVWSYCSISTPRGAWYKTIIYLLYTAIMRLFHHTRSMTS